MTGNPYPHAPVGERAWDASLEAGIDLFALAEWRTGVRRLFLFGRYDHYDSFVPANGWTDIEWAERQVLAAGINYYPLPQIAVKAEAGVRLLKAQYNNEPYAAVGITWCGFFKH